MNSDSDLGRAKRDDPRNIEELIALALSAETEEAAWEPVTVLHWKGSADVLHAATVLSASADPQRRKLGADVLGQLGVPDRTFPEECFRILAGMIAQERDPGVLSAIAVALGHLGDPRAVSLLLPLASNCDGDVRESVAFGLGGRDDPDAVATLIRLSSDTEGEVRNWATFGLGSMISADSPEIREALFARLTDTHDETREEAMAGLASRNDMRVLGPLKAELLSDSVGISALEAAEFIGDSSLYPALLRVQSWWDGGSEPLNRALERCTPQEAESGT